MKKIDFRTLREIPRGVWAIGFVTFFINFSGVIIFNFSSLYMVTVLSVSTLNIGLIEGVVEATSWVMRFLSGFLSDFLKKRKPSLILAYSVIAVSRIPFAFLPGIDILLMSRLIERLGNGIQASPREALIGDISPPSLKGASYGLRQSLSTLGSFLGAGSAMIIMHVSNESFAVLFGTAAITPFIGIIILLIFVHEHHKTPDIALTTGAPGATADPEREPKEKVTLAALIRTVCGLPATYWKVLIIACVFSMSLYSGSFLMLRAKVDFGMSLKDTPLIMMIQNIMTFAAAFPMGWLSDMFNRRAPLAIGMLLLIIGNLFLALGATPLAAIIGAAFWGAQVGITESLINTKIAESTPKKARGSAFGLYFLVKGTALLGTNALSGYLGGSFGNEWVFYASSLWAIAAIALLFILRTEPPKTL